MNTLSLPVKGKVAKATFAIGRDGVGWGASSGWINEIAAREPHPPPNLPLEGGGVDAYSIHAIVLHGSVSQSYKTAAIFGSFMLFLSYQ